MPGRERQVAGKLLDHSRRAAARADIVYVGDFHAEPSYQAFATELLERLCGRVPRLALGIEFVYTRQQRLLRAAAARAVVRLLRSPRIGKA